MTTHTHARAQRYCMSHAWTMRAQTGVISAAVRVCVDDYWRMIFTMCNWHRCLCLCVVVSSWSFTEMRKMCWLLTSVCEEEIWRILMLCFTVCVIKVKAACDHVRVCDIWPILHFTVNRMIRNFTSVSVYSESCCGLYDLWTLDLSWIEKHSRSKMIRLGPIADLIPWEAIKQKIDIRACLLRWFIWCSAWILRLIVMFGSDRL